MKYSELTPEQKKFICNGCGAKGGWIKPPSFLFKASCNHHDFNYWLGCTEEDRLKADKGFYEAMLDDADNAKWYLKHYYRLLAKIYFEAVRKFGSGAFYYADKKRTKRDLDIIS